MTLLNDSSPVVITPGDPPAVCDGAGSGVWGNHTALGDGGVSKPVPALSADGSCWAVVCGKSLAITDLRQLVAETEESGELRGAALIQVVSRLRETLEQIGDETDPDAEVSVGVVDLVLLGRYLLRRMQ